VKAWTQPSTPVIAHPCIDNFPAQVADPRLDCRPRAGTLGVQDWALPSHTVRGHHNTGNSPAALADPRVPEIDGPPLDMESKHAVHLVIRAADGTWHRPMTTLELAALQGLPRRIGGQWLKLDGRSHADWRERIGNMVPAPAAEAIARSCIAMLRAAAAGFELSNDAIWVRERELQEPLP
jgi:site-specific DNA-cytosine methylase